MRYIALLFLLFTSCQREVAATLMVKICPGDNTVKTEIFQLPCKLYKDSKLYRKIPQPDYPIYLPQSIRIDSLSKGNYTFEYPDMFGKMIKQNITIGESKMYHLNIYPDITKKSLKKNIIPNLKDGESLDVKLTYRGCFSSGESSFNILKKGKQFQISRNNSSKIFNENQIKYLISLENSIRQLDYGWCSTSSRIIFVLKNRTDTITDRGCQFNSLSKFEKFLKRNGL